MIGLLNWPNSMLAWDVIMLNGYLVLNIVIPFYILYSHYTGREPEKKKYVPFIYLSVVWAISIHLVTAFLFAGLPARPLPQKNSRRGLQLAPPRTFPPESDGAPDVCCHDATAVSVRCGFRA